MLALGGCAVSIMLALVAGDMGNTPTMHVSRYSDGDLQMSLLDFHRNILTSGPFEQEGLRIYTGVPCGTDQMLISGVRENDPNTNEIYFRNLNGDSRLQASGVGFQEILGCDPKNQGIFYADQINAADQTLSYMLNGQIYTIVNATAGSGRMGIVEAARDNNNIAFLRHHSTQQAPSTVDLQIMDITDPAEVREITTLNSEQIGNARDLQFVDGENVFYIRDTRDGNNFAPITEIMRYNIEDGQMSTVYKPEPGFSINDMILDQDNRITIIETSENSTSLVVFNDQAQRILSYPISDGVNPSRWTLRINDIEDDRVLVSYTDIADFEDYLIMFNLTSGNIDYKFQGGTMGNFDR